MVIVIIIIIEMIMSVVLYFVNNELKNIFYIHRNTPLLGNFAC